MGKRFCHVKTFFCIMGVLLSLQLFTASGWSQESEAWKKLSLNWFTGDPSGTGYSLAVAIEGAIRKVIPTLSVTNFIPTGANGMVAGVASGRGMFGGPVNSFSVVSATRGESGFKQPLQHIRTAAAFQVFIVHIMVNADSPIKGIADLKGMRIAAGPTGSTPEYILRYLLESHGMSAKDVKFTHMGYGESVDAFKNGQVDAVCLSAHTPFPLFVDVSRARKIRLLQLTDSEINFLHKKNSSMSRATIPAGTYRGVDSEIRSAAAPAVLVCQENLPTQFIYHAVKGMAENITAITKSAPGFHGFRPQDLARDIGVPFHPGAEKYYREAGWLK